MTTMNQRACGNIGLAQAVTHFSALGYYIFTPFGDHTGPIDLVVSPDGIKTLRVQCKYTTQVHEEMLRRYGKTVYRVTLASVIHNNSLQTNKATSYTADAFDILFAATPTGNWLLDWPALCGATRAHSRTTGPPRRVTLGNRIKAYLWQQPL